MIVELFSLVAAFCYTFSGVLAVFGMKDHNPTAVTFISILANVAFLWPVTLLFSPIIFNSSAILLYAVSAAFAPVSGRWLNYLSLERVGVSNTTTISGLQPIIVAVLAAIFLSERFPAIIYVAIVITTVGVVIIGRSRSSADGKKTLTKWTLIFPLSSTFCYASSNIIRKEGLKIQGLPFLAASVTCSFSAMYMFLPLLYTRRAKIAVTRLSLTFPILSGLVNSLAWVFSYQALDMGDASIVSTILGIQPLIAIMLSYIFLRKTEVITAGKIVGAALVVFGVALISILK